MRWALYLSCFDFCLTHRSGKANTQADPLSRLDIHQISNAEDNRQQTVLKPKQFAHLAAASMIVNPLEEQLRKNSARKAEVLAGLATLHTTGPWCMLNGSSGNS